MTVAELIDELKKMPPYAAALVFQTHPDTGVKDSPIIEGVWLEDEPGFDPIVFLGLTAEHELEGGR